MLSLLVELDQRLGELIQVLVLAALDVHVGERQASSAPGGVERLPEPRELVAERVPARRVEPGAVPEHLADLLVLPRRHVLEHVQLLDHVADAEGAAIEKTKGGPRSPSSISRTASVASEAQSLSQSSEDWCVTWKRSSSRCTHSSGPF